MKILMVNNLSTMYGGAEAMIKSLRCALEEEGHQVRILGGKGQGEGENIADAEFTVGREGSLLQRLMYVFNPFALLSLRRELRQYRPDVVHLHAISRTSPFILLPLKRYPVLLTMHDQSLFDPTRASDLSLLSPYCKTFSDYFIDRPSLRYFGEKFRFFVLRLLAGNVDTVLACSDFYAACARDSGIFPRIKTLHNGIALPPPAPMNNFKDVLFVGRLSEEKGIPVLLEAAAMLKKKHPDMRLRIVGAGHMMEALKKQAADLQIGGIVQLLGYKSCSEIIELYGQSSLVAVPSLCPDNLPTVCIEAMAIGRPIVGSRIGGIPELIDHEKTGLLVPPEDAAALADAIDRLLSDPELMQKMGAAGRKKAEEGFNDKIYVQNTILEYDHLINQHQKI